MDIGKFFTKLKNDPSRAFLLIDVFFGGAIVMALEIVASRLVAPYFGSSVYVWSSLIGIILASLSGGYFLGGILADRYPTFEFFSMLVFVSGGLVILIPFISDPWFTMILNSGSVSIYTPLFAVIPIFGPPSIVLGMLSPFAIKLLANKIEHLGGLSGNLYSLSTFGSIVGTFSAAFILIPLWGTKEIIFSFGIILLLLSLLGQRNWIRVGTVVVLSLCLIPIQASLVQQNMIPGMNNRIDINIIYEGDSLYHHIEVLEKGDIRYLYMDNLGTFMHTAKNMSDPEQAVLQYTDVVHLAHGFNQNISNVLIIGGGGGTIAMKFHRDYPEMIIDVVEIDPEVIYVAKTYFGLIEDERLKVYAQDGRQFLASTDKTYDLVVMDIYDHSYIPFHLLTYEYFQLLYNHLEWGGVVAFNIATALNGPFSDLFRHEYLTVSHVFSQVYTLPLLDFNSTRYSQEHGMVIKDPESWVRVMMNVPTSVIQFLVKSSTSIEKQAFMHRINISDKINVPNKDLYASYLFEGEIDTSDVSVLTDNWAPVNNMLNPIMRTEYLNFDN